VRLKLKLIYNMNINTNFILEIDFMI